MLLGHDATGATVLLDRAEYMEDAAGGHWVRHSGAPVLDAAGHAILRATLQDVLAQSASAVSGQGYGQSALGHTVSVSVTLADGKALPSWLAFDPAGLTLIGAAPAGTARFAVLATYSYLDPLTGGTQTLRRNIIVDPAKVGEGIKLEGHVATLSLGAGTWNAHMAGNQPLPEWLDFDPTTHTLAFSDYASAPGTKPARIAIDFVPVEAMLPNGTYASSHGGFTLEFVIDPASPLDPAINAVLASDAYFTQQNLFGVDLARASAVTALLANGSPLPDWLQRLLMPSSPIAVKNLPT